MPYPANRERIEYAAGDLLDAQAASTKAFQLIVTNARTAITALVFPLGSPSRHFDLADITGALDDLLVFRSEDDLEADALEIATRDEDDALADAAEYRADLAREEGWRGLAA